MKFMNLSAWALAHPSMVRFLMLLCAVGGIYGYRHLGQMEDPQFTVKSMIVRADWPGASAEQIAEQVTDRIEQTLQEIAEIDNLTSFAKPGITQITVTLRDDVPAHKVADVWYQVRKKIGDMQQTLPQGVQGPTFNDEFGDTFGNLYAFTGDGFDHSELRRYVEQARDEFLRVPDVSKIEFIGVQDEKIFVETSSAKLASLALDPRLIENTLRDTNGVEPAGVVEADVQRVALRVTGEFDSVAAIADIGIEAGGRHLRLGDVAHVHRGLVDPPTARMHFDGHEAIGLAIAMRDGGDVIALGRNLAAAVERIHAALPVGIEIHAVSDQPAVVRDSIDEFTKSLVEAVVIVLGVSFVTLGVHSGLVVALSIPLVLAGTFLTMYIVGIDLQRISLGALIIALGLLVDDAIIAVEMMVRKLDEGFDVLRAATFAYQTSAFPMLTGTLITASGFIPVGLARSGAGEYTVSLFQVVGIALLLSWIVAVVFTPYLGSRLLVMRRGRQPTSHHSDDGYQSPFYRGFRRLLEACLSHRKCVLGLTAAALIAAIGLFSTVPQQFFPASNRPELMVDLWLPQAGSFTATEQAVTTLEQQLRTDPDVAAVTGFVGIGSPRFYLPLDVQLPSLNFGQLLVLTRGEAVRDQVMARIQTVLEQDHADVRGRVTRLENGPPVGYPIQLRVTGPNAQRLAPVVAQLEEILRRDPAAYNVNTDAGERLQTVRLVIDQDKARALGMTSKQIAAAMQGSLSGRSITQYRERDRSIDVVTRLSDDERTDLANLKDAKVYLDNGRFVALSQIANLELGSETSIVRRRDRMASVTVRADVTGAEAPDVTARLWPAIETVAQQLPLGYRIEVGGATEQAARSQASIAAAVPAMLALVLLLLMAQLKEMKKMVLVVLTAPLGMIGVVTVLATFQVPFGFVAMLGTIALAGMIMRNSIILIDQIDQDLATGKAPWEALVDSTVRRLRPIVLTALTAILAMIPLSESTFWGPMALAIVGGLTAATVLTLIVLPTLYAVAYDVPRAPAAAQPTLALIAGRGHALPGSEAPRSRDAYSN